MTSASVILGFFSLLAAVAPCEGEGLAPEKKTDTDMDIGSLTPMQFHLLYPYTAAFHWYILTSNLNLETGETDKPEAKDTAIDARCIAIQCSFNTTEKVLLRS